jgi:hypothetical protein
VTAAGHELARGQEVLPRVGWDLEDLELVEARLALEEQRFGEAAGEGRFPDLGRAVDQDGLLRQIGGGFAGLVG